MISTHILDISNGIQAVGIKVELQKYDGKSWRHIQELATNDDGRCLFDCEKKVGHYKLIFKVEGYLKKSREEYFFKNIPVEFEIKSVKRKYHVPLLLSPFGYSTYRGS